MLAPIHSKVLVYKEKKQTMAIASTTTTSVYDLGLRQYMIGVYNNMGLGLAISGIISYLVGTVPALTQFFLGGPQAWLFMLAPLGLVFYISFKAHEMSFEKARALFFTYSALMGISLGSIFMVYQLGSIFQVFFITAATFGAVSLYGYTTKRDLTSVGTFMFMGLIGIVIASLVNIFLQSSALAFAVSLVGVVVFVGLTAYDTQKIKDTYDMVGESEREKAGILGALTLYLDFINLMLHLLQLFGQRK